MAQISLQNIEGSYCVVVDGRPKESFIPESGRTQFSLCTVYRGCIDKPGDSGVVASGLTHKDACQRAYTLALSRAEELNVQLNRGSKSPITNLVTRSFQSA